MAIGDNNKNKKKRRIGGLGLGEETQEYVERAYDQYARPYEQQFEALGKATKKEALAKGLYLSGDYGRAIGDNIEDYSRKVAENVVMPMAREGMQMGLQAEQLGLQERSQTEQERSARVGERFQAAGLTGLYGGGAADMRSLGLNPNDVNAFLSRDQMGRATPEERATWERRVGDAFIAQTGRELAPGEFNAIMGGGSIATAGTQTLGGRAAAEQERAARVGETERERAARAGETLAGRAQTEQTRAAKAREALGAEQLEEQVRAAGVGEQATMDERAERARQFDASQRQQRQQFLTTATGRVSGPMTARDFGVTPEQLAGVYDANGNVNYDAYFAAVDPIAAAAESQGIHLTNDMVNKMLRGEQVDISGAPTLDRQRLTDQRDQFTATLAQDLTLSDAERGERKRQFDISTMRRQIEYATDVTGKYGAGSIDAELLGVDIEDFTVRNEDGSFSEWDWDRMEEVANDLKGVAEVAGLDLSEQDIGRILSGQSVAVTGMPTMEGRKMAAAEAAVLHERRIDKAALLLQQERQDLDEAITRAQQSGTYRDPVTGDTMDTLEQDRLDMEERSRYLELTGSVDGKDEDGRFLSSLAATYQSKQLVWEDTRQKLESAIARAGQSGRFLDPETNLTVDTLQKQLQDANIRIQDANFGFQQEKEYARQRESFAELTGTFKQGEVSMDMLGLDEDEVYLEDGSVNVQYIMRMSTSLSANAKKFLGRDLTRGEQQALLRGEKIPMGDPLDTLAKLAQQAGFTGMYGDEKPTLEKSAQDFAERIREAELTGELGEGEEKTKTLAKLAQEAGYTGKYEDDDTLEKLLAEAALTGEYGPDDKATLDSVIQMAQLTGFLGDGDDKVATLQGNRQQFDQEIATRVQALNEQTESYRQSMEMAREKGYWEIGESGTITAEDLGIDTTYTSQLNDRGDILSSYEATRLKDTYREMSGEELTDEDTMRMLGGQGKTVSSPIRVQTLAARSESNREQMERANLFGELGEMKTEAARQFDENLSLRTNLQAADVARINADVARADKQLEAQITQWVSQTNLDIAGITGQFGVSGEITAEDLGVTITNDGTYQGVDDQIQKDGDAFRQAFTSSFGREPTRQEVTDAFMGKALNVEATPTLQGRQLSQLISSQSLDRANDMSKFAKQHGLELSEFAEMQSQYDDSHGLLVEQTANQFNLDRSQFALARQDLEAKHTGQWQFSGTITAADLGFNADEFAAMDNKEKNAYAKALQATYKTLQGENLPGGWGRAMELLSGRNPVSVEAAWTQDARESARRYGLDERNFLEATDQFNRKFEESNQQAWMQIVGYGEDDKGKTRYTQGYRAWKTAQEDLEKVQKRQDVGWEALMRKAHKTSADAGESNMWRLHESLQEGVGPSSEYHNLHLKKISDIADLIQERYEADVGYPISRKQAFAEAKEYKNSQGREAPVLGVYQWEASNEEAAAIINFINGHSQQVTESASGWSAAGNILGQAMNIGGQVLAAKYGGSDPGLKQNVMHVGYSPSGLNVYEFNYKPGLGPAGRYRGVMSNEIPQSAVIPRAILGRYDAVNYSKVDVDFERLR
mgnify:CR=1 FL=1